MSEKRPTETSTEESATRIIRTAWIKYAACEAVRKLFLVDNAISTGLVNIPYDRSSFCHPATVRFICVRPMINENTYRITFQIDNKTRKINVRVVPVSQMLQLVIQHNKDALDEHLSDGESLLSLAVNWLNADGIINVPPYGPTDPAICGFQGVFRENVFDSGGDWEACGSFGHATKFIIYERNM